MRPTVFTTTTAALALAATTAMAAPETYELDPGHSQVVFTYNHLGFSTTTGMFGGFEGEIQFDEADPANSSVSVAMPVMSMFTGWEKRDVHFMSDEFFGAEPGDLVTFTSTDIEVTGENTAVIIGDLTMNGITKSVALDTVMNQKVDAHPMNNHAQAQRFRRRYVRALCERRGRGDDLDRGRQARVTGSLTTHESAGPSASRAALCVRCRRRGV
jgi:polyisoprenoid-binding protein YceI